jgi:hypothetical protein
VVVVGTVPAVMLAARSIHALIAMMAQGAGMTIGEAEMSRAAWH